jgi:hypothetical protein
MFSNSYAPSAGFFREDLAYMEARTYPTIDNPPESMEEAAARFMLICIQTLDYQSGCCTANVDLTDFSYDPDSHVLHEVLSGKSST